MNGNVSSKLNNHTFKHLQNESWSSRKPAALFQKYGLVFPAFRPLLFQIDADVNPILSTVKKNRSDTLAARERHLTTIKGTITGFVICSSLLPTFLQYFVHLGQIIGTIFFFYADTKQKGHTQLALLMELVHCGVGLISLGKVTGFISVSRLFFTTF